MFVSCRFLGDGCELQSCNFSIKEVVMDDEQVEQRWDPTWQVDLVSAINKFYQADAQTHSQTRRLHLRPSVPARDN